MSKITVISAVWCPSCLILKKDLKRIKEEHPDVEIEMLDYDFDEDIVSTYNIGDKLPVIMAGDNRLIGEKSYDDIVSFLKENKVI